MRIDWFLDVPSLPVVTNEPDLLPATLAVDGQCCFSFGPAVPVRSVFFWVKVMRIDWFLDVPSLPVVTNEPDHLPVKSSAAKTDGARRASPSTNPSDLMMIS